MFDALDRFLLESRRFVVVEYALRTSESRINIKFPFVPTHDQKAVIDRLNAIPGYRVLDTKPDPDKTDFWMWFSSGIDVKGLSHAIAQTLADNGASVRVIKSDIPKDVVELELIGKTND